MKLSHFVAAILGMASALAWLALMSTQPQAVLSSGVTLFVAIALISAGLPLTLSGHRQWISSAGWTLLLIGSAYALVALLALKEAGL